MSKKCSICPYCHSDVNLEFTENLPIDHTSLMFDAAENKIVPMVYGSCLGKKAKGINCRDVFVVCTPDNKPSHISARIWCEKCRMEFNGVVLI